MVGDVDSRYVCGGDDGDAAGARLLLRQPPALAGTRAIRLARVGLSPHLPAGHDNDVRRHRGLPDRYGVRRPHRACLLAGHRDVEQPPSARGHRCELAFTGVVICASWPLEVLGTTGLGADQFGMLPPFSVIVLGVDEFVRVTGDDVRQAPSSLARDFLLYPQPLRCSEDIIMTQTLDRSHVDDELGAGLHAVLDRSLDVPPTVRASVLNKQVTRFGTAHWQLECVAADRLVGEIKGIRSVVNHFVVNPTALMLGMRTAIRGRLLRQAKAEVTRIDARTDDVGVIEVTGAAGCRSESGNVKQICRSLPTVTGVVRHFQIRDGEARR